MFTKGLTARLCTTALTAGLLAAATLPALANENDQFADRISSQQARIQRGVASGQMTRQEYYGAEARLQRAEALRRKYFSEGRGHITQQQRETLNQFFNSNSKAIYFDNHNTYRQPGH